MFYQASAFNQDIGWDTSQVRSMRYMFKGEYYNKMIFNEDIGGWNVGNVVDFEGMFRLPKFQPKYSWSTSQQRAWLVCLAPLYSTKTFHLGTCLL